MRLEERCETRAELRMIFQEIDDRRRVEEEQRPIREIRKF
jgi:hypothetical protein